MSFSHPVLFTICSLILSSASLLSLFSFPCIFCGSVWCQVVSLFPPTNAALSLPGSHTACFAWSFF